MDVQDQLSGSGAKLCVKIIVPSKDPVQLLVPLEPSASASQADCPDAATMAQIVADYVAAFKAQPGVEDLKLTGMNCTWLVSAGLTYVYIAACSAGAVVLGAADALALARARAACGSSARID